MKSTIIFLLFCFSLQYVVAQSSIDQTTIRSKQFNIEKSGLAIQGYDPVSYYIGKPQKGSSNFSSKFNGITYRFVSSKNMDLFKISPEKFEPAYGGWCAYAMGAKGEKVEVDPETFKIVNGKLYLFYNAVFNNTLPKWNEDEKNLNKKADVNWQKLTK